MKYEMTAMGKLMRENKKIQQKARPEGERPKCLNKNNPPRKRELKEYYIPAHAGRYKPEEIIPM